MEQFSYLPAEAGEVSHNQFQKAVSIGQMYLNDDVENIIEKALKKELAYAGFNIDDESNTRIDADVTRFYYDWTGFFEVDFEVGVTFYLSRNGELEMKHESFSHIKAPKALNSEPEAVRSAISECIDDFLSEANQRNFL